jgi:hypothetical protein
MYVSLAPRDVSFQVLVAELYQSGSDEISHVIATATLVLTGSAVF